MKGTNDSENNSKGLAERLRKQTDDSTLAWIELTRQIVREELQARKSKKK